MSVPWPSGDDTVIQWQQDNPKKIGSKSWERYEKYKGSHTVREAKKNGAGSADFNNDYEKGFLKILNVPPEKKTEAKVEAKLDTSKKKSDSSATSSNGKRKATEEATAPTPKKEVVVKESKKDSTPKSSASSAASGKKRKAFDDVEEPATSKEIKKEPKQSKKESLAEQKVAKDLKEEKDELKEEEAPTTENLTTEESSSWWSLPSTLANRVCRKGEGPTVWKVKTKDGAKLKLIKKDKKHKKHKKDKKHKKNNDADDQSEDRSAEGPGASSTAIPSSGVSRKSRSAPELPTITDSNGLYIRINAKAHSASQFVGVTPYSRNPGKWKATLCEGSGASLSLGIFDTEEEAARAFARAFKDPEAARKSLEDAKGSGEKAAEVQEKATHAEERKKKMSSIRFRTEKEVTTKKASNVKPVVASDTCTLKPASETCVAQPSNGQSIASEVTGAATTSASTTTQPIASSSMGSSSASSSSSSSSNASRKSHVQAKPLVEAEVQQRISKGELQRQINELDEQQLDQVIEFLSSDANAKEGYYELDLASMPYPKLVELNRIIMAARSNSPKQSAIGAEKAPPLQKQAPKLVPSAVKAGVNGVVNSPMKTPGAAVTMQAAPKNADLGRQQLDLRQYSKAALEQIPHTPEVAPERLGSHIAPAHLGRTENMGSVVFQGRISSEVGHMAHSLVGTPLEADVWLGEDGIWAAGFEPPDMPVSTLQPPLIPLGNTYPPGACNGHCGCSKAVMQRVTDMERPWRTPERAARVQAAMQAFESQAGVVRRGTVSRMNRFEPAPPGVYERRAKQRQAPPQPSRSLHPPAAAASSSTVIVVPTDTTPPISSL